MNEKLNKVCRAYFKQPTHILCILVDLTFNAIHYLQPLTLLIMVFSPRDDHSRPYSNDVF